MKYEYNHQEFVYDVLTKKIFMNDVRIWQDTENQIGDPDYYDTFEDWVHDNYSDYINDWLGTAGCDKFNDYPDDLKDFIKTSDIYLIGDNGVVTEDGKYMNVDDVREQMDYMRDTVTSDNVN